MNTSENLLCGLWQFTSIKANFIKEIIFCKSFTCHYSCLSLPPSLTEAAPVICIIFIAFPWYLHLSWLSELATLSHLPAAADQDRTACPGQEKWVYIQFSSFSLADNLNATNTPVRAGSWLSEGSDQQGIMDMSTWLECRTLLIIFTSIAFICITLTGLSFHSDPFFKPTKLLTGISHAHACGSVSHMQSRALKKDVW